MDRSAENVRDTYDEIAGHFASTREYPWPEVREFVDGVTPAPASVGLDLGCGNARHAELLADECGDVVGIDISRALLETARVRARDRSFSIELLQGDAASIPVRTATVDVGIYVATLHHLPDRVARVGSLNELGRVLAPGGRALVSAWSTEHDRFDRTEGFDTTVDWTLPGGERIGRFYHIYDPTEFQEDLDRAGLRACRTFVSSGNCYAVIAAP